MKAALPLAALVDALRARLHRAGQARDAELVETHISLVLLAGDFAWKFKKPVDFGFVDFSTLARRQHYCEREIALNRRFAPDIYLDVATIEEAGTREYAVHMRRFPRAATLDVLIARGAVTQAALADFATRLAASHASAPPLPAPSAFGSAEVVRAQIEACLAPPLLPYLPTGLRDVLTSALERAQALLAARHANGMVRDCHGDLHCANVVAYQDCLQAFDCIEFNDELRIIDTLSDAAFLLMDLDRRQAAQLGHVFLNRYLEERGDHAGLALLPLYCAYRALVRAKVALLRGGQQAGAVQAAEDLAGAHIELATRYLAPTGRAGLVLTHGLSGSGKSHHARRLAERAGFIHLRSDIERRRLAGLALDARSTPAQRLYDKEATRATYQGLAARARAALAAGFSVVVDATFLRSAERAPFAALAREFDAPFSILACQAPSDELRRRIVERAARGDDPSEATVEVMAQQMSQVEPFSAAEQAVVVDAASLTDDDAALTAFGRPRPA